MLRRLSLISLALVGLISSEVWALGLGEIRLDSALNEPLRAEIELLSATPEELSNLKVSMADGGTFDRYGLDRPAFLSDIEFMIINGVVEVRSRAPISEPFSTTTTARLSSNCISRHAAASPAGPPPTITTSNSMDSRSIASDIAVFLLPSSFDNSSRCGGIIFDIVILPGC
jgi:hypothetical protein